MRKIVLLTLILWSGCTTTRDIFWNDHTAPSLQLLSHTAGETYYTKTNQLAVYGTSDIISNHYITNISITVASPNGTATFSSTSFTYWTNMLTLQEGNNHITITATSDDGGQSSVSFDTILEYIIYVAHWGEVSNPGTRDKPVLSIQAGVTLASSLPHREVHISGEFYSSTNGISVDNMPPFQISVWDDMYIIGGWNSNFSQVSSFTTLDGMYDLLTPFFFAGNCRDVHFRNFKIQNTQNGAFDIQTSTNINLSNNQFSNCNVFIWNFTTSPVVTQNSDIKILDCDFIDNNITRYSLVWSSQSRVQILNSRFLYNFGSTNSLIFLKDSSAALLSNVTFYSNYTYNGNSSAVIITNSTLSAYDCIFDRTLGTLNDGSLQVWDSSATIQDCAFSNNSGYGIYNHSGTAPTLTGNIFYNNTLGDKNW